MDDKQKRFILRTMHHISRVQNHVCYLVLTAQSDLELADEECRMLVRNSLMHDLSKFDCDLYHPFIELSEFYRQKKLGNTEYDYASEEVRKEVSSAVALHYSRENHHPQSGNFKGVSIPKVQLIEVCCDLQAMSDEMGEGGCIEYFNTRWKDTHKDNFHPYKWDEVTEFMTKVITLLNRG